MHLHTYSMYANVCMVHPFRLAMANGHMRCSFETMHETRV